MKTIIKVLIVLIVAMFTCISVFSQNITTVGYSFRIKNDYSKSLTCKQFFQIDFVRNDTVRFIKISFQDQVKAYNNGYIILNGQKNLEHFIDDLEVMKTRLYTNEEVTILKPPYKLDINNPENRLRFQNNLNKKICIYEPNSTAFIAFKEEKLVQLIENLKKIVW